MFKQLINNYVTTYTYICWYQQVTSNICSNIGTNIQLTSNALLKNIV
jgi:hypothetical protein